ncbi:glycosyltransferase family 2 protein [Anaerovibrio sp. RM50]|uniref:glycosyltransferase family 2 protein n=1 Tax=Anaerovibrio sp. RM50 TaxID=1200557 RepID=UPI0004840C9A|nr:glycosyltransferase family 2 protein [Anaerovibrio sp. RM50]
MSKLTILILAKNEEKNIEDCVKSALFADEVLVIDDFSTDNTVKIAEELGAKVIQHSLDGNWGQQKTFGINEAQGDWIFFLDADERITEVLQSEIIKAVSSGEKIAYYIARLNHFCGNVVKYSGWFPDYGIRLIPKEGSYVTGYVHEQVHYNCPEKYFPKSAYMLHYTYVSWEQYLRKLNNYTTLGAKKQYDAGKRAGILDIVFHTLFGVIKIFFIQRAFMDGMTGLFLTVGHGISVFMKYTKLYYLSKGIGEKS